MAQPVKQKKIYPSTALSYAQEIVELLQKTSVTGISGETLPFDTGIQMAMNIILSAEWAGKKIILIGNGGSAAVASHIHADLSNMGIMSHVLTDAALLTAFSNDYGYEHAYEKAVKLMAKKEDVLIAISSSGKSKNILYAAQAAASSGCHVLTLSGFKPDNPLRWMGEINFYVPSHSYGLVESAHGILTHFLTDQLKTHMEEKDGKMQFTFTESYA